jgi:hypothetical protein
MLFGSLMAQTHNMNKTRGRDRTWKDFFPIEIAVERRGVVVSDAQAIEMFKQYNKARGYD